jgi:uncharacterized membrane protein YbhN (UPF0104 family)
MKINEPSSAKTGWRRINFKRTSQGAKLVGYGFLFCVLLAVVMWLVDYFLK